MGKFFSDNKRTAIEIKKNEIPLGSFKIVKSTKAKMMMKKSDASKIESSPSSVVNHEKVLLEIFPFWKVLEGDTRPFEVL